MLDSKPFIPVPVIKEFGVRISTEVSVASEKSIKLQDSAVANIEVALATGLLHKAVSMLLLIDEVGYGDIGFQVITSLPVPAPKRSLKDILERLDAVFEGEMDSAFEPSASLNTDVIAPSSELYRNALVIINDQISDAWLVEQILDLSEARTGLQEYWLDTGLTYMAFVYAAMVLMADSFEPSALRHYLCLRLEEELKHGRLAAHSVPSEKTS